MASRSGQQCDSGSGGNSKQPDEENGDTFNERNMTAKTNGRRVVAFKLQTRQRPLMV